MLVDIDEMEVKVMPSCTSRDGRVREKVYECKTLGREWHVSHLAAWAQGGEAGFSRTLCQGP